MKTIEEIVADRKKRQDQSQLSDDLSSGYEKAAYSSSSIVKDAIADMKEELAEMTQAQRLDYWNAMQILMKELGGQKEMSISNLADMPKPEATMNFNLQGVERIEAKSVDIVGLADTLSQITTGLTEVKNELKALEIKVPDITIPKVTVPKPEVTVNIPPIKMPKLEMPYIPPINVPKAEITVVQERGPQITEYTPQYDSFGNLARFTEVYSDGSRCIATFESDGKIKVKHD